jgi:hypothetical protein
MVKLYVQLVLTKSQTPGIFMGFSWDFPEIVPKVPDGWDFYKYLYYQIDRYHNPIYAWPHRSHTAELIG